MKLIQRGPIWYAEFTDFNGRRRRLSTDERDKTVAKIKALDLQRQAMLDDANPEVRATVADRQYSLTHALEECLRTRWAGQKSGRVRQYSVRAIQRAIGHWPLHTITYKKLMDHCETLSGKTPATINRHMSYIGTALREAAKRGEIGTAPHMPHFAENNVKERYLNIVEEAVILDRLYRKGMAEGDYAYMRDLVVLLLDSGMRCTEALTIQPDQFVDGRVRLKHGDTKSGKGRVVPLTDRARQAMRAMLNDPRHGLRDADWAGRRWRTTMGDVGLPDVTLHTLRHTCASRLIQRGVDIYLVSKWLGHSSLEITKRYAHLATTSLDAAMGVLEAGCVVGSGAIAEPVAVPAPVGTVEDDKLMIDVGILGAKGETRSAL